MRKHKTGILAVILLLAVFALSFFFFRKSPESFSTAEVRLPLARIEIDSTEAYQEVQSSESQKTVDLTQLAEVTTDAITSFSGSNSLLTRNQSSLEKEPSSPKASTSSKKADPKPDTKPAQTKTTTGSAAKPDTTVIHHEAEYKTVHHEAIVIHHKAEYRTVHHEAEGHYEETVVSPAWDETIENTKTEQHVICNESSCKMDFTAAGFSVSQIWEHLEAHAFDGKASGHHTEDIEIKTSETIHHDTQVENIWVVDKEAWDEKVISKEAWDEVIPAWDEKVLIKESWDEKVSR